MYSLMSKRLFFKMNSWLLQTIFLRSNINFIKQIRHLLSSSDSWRMLRARLKNFKKISKTTRKRSLRSSSAMLSTFQWRTTRLIDVLLSILIITQIDSVSVSCSTARAKESTNLVQSVSILELITTISMWELEEGTFQSMSSLSSTLQLSLTS